MFLADILLKFNTLKADIKLLFSGLILFDRFSCKFVFFLLSAGVHPQSGQDCQGYRGSRSRSVDPAAGGARLPPLPQAGQGTAEATSLLVWLSFCTLNSPCFTSFNVAFRSHSVSLSFLGVKSLISSHR